MENGGRKLFSELLRKRDASACRIFQFLFIDISYLIRRFWTILNLQKMSVAPECQTAGLGLCGYLRFLICKYLEIRIFQFLFIDISYLIRRFWTILNLQKMSVAPECQTVGLGLCQTAGLALRPIFLLKAIGHRINCEFGACGFRLRL